jgi:hypothetical protein
MQRCTAQTVQQIAKLEPDINLIVGATYLDGGTPTQAKTPCRSPPNTYEKRRPLPSGRLRTSVRTVEIALGTDSLPTRNKWKVAGSISGDKLQQSCSVRDLCHPTAASTKTGVQVQEPPFDRPRISILPSLSTGLNGRCFQFFKFCVIPSPRLISPSCFRTCRPSFYPQ